MLHKTILLNAHQDSKSPTKAVKSAELALRDERSQVPRSELKEGGKLHQHKSWLVVYRLHTFAKPPSDFSFEIEPKFPVSSVFPLHSLRNPFTKKQQGQERLNSLSSDTEHSFRSLDGFKISPRSSIKARSV